MIRFTTTAALMTGNMDVSRGLRCALGGCLSTHQSLQLRSLSVVGHVDLRLGSKVSSLSNVSRCESVTSNRRGETRRQNLWRTPKIMCQSSQTSSKPDAMGDGGRALREKLLGQLSENAESYSSKPETCTADELHYVQVPGTVWRLALWRYIPSSSAPKRNHPLLLLSGIGTNALGFDLDPSVSMARFLAAAGFDTWILEVRGAGLSKSEAELRTEEEEEAAEETGDADVIVEDNSDSGNGGLATLGSTDGLSGGGEGTKLVQTLKPPIDVSTPTDAKSDELQVPSSSLAVKEDVPSSEAWNTASRILNSVLDLSEKLYRVLSIGQSNAISARFIERLSSLMELNLRSGRIAELKDWLASLLEVRESSTMIPSKMIEMRDKLAKLVEEGQLAVSPRVTNLQERVNSTVDEFQKIVDLIAKYDWDFDDYLNEDVPAALDYICKTSKPADGKVMSIGHSMGGIVIYARLSSKGPDSRIAAAVSLASALDYGVSNSTLKSLLPLADPAQLLNVPVVPLGALMAAVQPLIARPPYALAWLGYNVSAQNMMDALLFEKLILNNFGTIPVKLLLHLSTAFQAGGLQNRDGSFRYKDNICKCDVPVLAVAADQDLICPPVAVLDTVKEFPQDVITYKVFGGDNGVHYGHYDLVCSPAARGEVFPFILDFLQKHDALATNESGEDA